MRVIQLSRKHAKGTPLRLRRAFHDQRAMTVRWSAGRGLLGGPEARWSAGILQAPVGSRAFRLLGGKDEVGARVRGEPLFCVNERLHEGRDRHAMSSAFFHLDGWDSEHVRLDPRLSQFCVFARSQHRAE